MKRENELKGVGYSFGDIDILHLKDEKSARTANFTIRVETKLCHFAFIDCSSLLEVLT